MEYSEKIDLDNKKKLQLLLQELPKFCKDYFRYLDVRNTSSRTRLAYAYDLRLFFQFIARSNPLYADIPMRDIPIAVLDQMTPMDVEEYLSYLSYYENKDGTEKMNGEKGKSRKLSSLRTMYNYFFKKELITSNAPAMVETPKKHKDNIVHLDRDEVSDLVAAAETGATLTSKQLALHEKTKHRDTAILTLLIGTGVRVSELVGLDVKDVNFKYNSIRVIRKGGNESTVYFGEEVANTLKEYLEVERGNFAEKARPGSEQALFLSMKYGRLTARAVEMLVKKYSNSAGISKKITPHKLRSTYGTNLYKESGDIYLVADALGHRSVETTRQHYANMDEERRRLAGKFSENMFKKNEA